MSALGRSYWNDAASYAYLRNADRAGLMWEWLRRDPGYLAWHVQASSVTGGPRCDILDWGLHFRRRTGPGLSLGPDSLARCARSIHALRRSRARQTGRWGLPRSRQVAPLADGGPGKFGHGARSPFRRKPPYQARRRFRLPQPPIGCSAALRARWVGKGRRLRAGGAAPPGPAPARQVRQDALSARSRYRAGNSAA